ncbi:MAG: hypothetical protein ACPG43_09885, partial [Alcanivoracaceae bacterium]
RYGISILGSNSVGAVLIGPAWMEELVSTPNIDLGAASRKFSYFDAGPYTMQAAGPTPWFLETPPLPFSGDPGVAEALISWEMTVRCSVKNGVTWHPSYYMFQGGPKTTSSGVLSRGRFTRIEMDLDETVRASGATQIALPASGSDDIWLFVQGSDTLNGNYDLVLSDISLDARVFDR